MMFFNVNIDDVLFWMDAIRNSQDRDRTLESFWKGQIRSKVWLIENLKQHVDYQRGYKVAIYGGWNGVLASLLYNSRIGMRHITSVDIDPSCEEIASTMNKRHEMRGTFTAITADMCEYTVEDADIVINTSCEHITQEQYDGWLQQQPRDALIVVQSNNYFELPEHINCKNNVEEFKNASGLTVWYSDTLNLPKYDRYMIIGNKDV
jgi:hypothetical protein